MSEKNKIQKVKKHFNLGAFVSKNVRQIAFYGSSVISAAINLIFIGHLSNDAKIIMVGISLTLELSKLWHVTMYNTTKEITRKLADFPDSQVQMKKVTSSYFRGYLGFAFIAVIAAIFFSMTNLGKESSAIDTKIAQHELVRTNAQTSENELKELNAIIDSLEKALSDPTEADNIYSSLENARKAVRKTPIIEETGSYDKESDEWKVWVDFVNDFNNKVVGKSGYFNYSETRQLYTKGCSISEIQSFINVSYKAQIEASQKTFDAKKNSYKNQISKVLDENDVISALTDFNGSTLIQLKINELNNSKIADAGSQGAFVIMSNVTHIPEDVIRTVLILILSLLVEFTIYRTSPKIEIDREMMWDFTQFLPANFNIDKFMKGVDAELLAYSKRKLSTADEIAISKSEAETAVAETKAAAVEAKIKVKRARKAKKSVDKSIEELPDNIVEVKEFTGSTVKRHKPSVEKLEEAISSSNDEEAQQQQTTTVEEKETLEENAIPHRKRSEVVKKTEESQNTTENTVNLININSNAENGSSEETQQPQQQENVEKAANLKLANDQPKTQLKSYRFGNTTPAAALKYKSFIDKIVAGEGQPFNMTPEAAALQVDISSKTKDVFMKYLTMYKKNGKNLVVQIKGTYYSNFDAETIKSFLFQEV